jgi:carboxyl-terminal processing protease
LSDFFRRGLSSHIAAFVAGVALATAFGVSAETAPTQPAPRFAKLDVFAEALSFVENNYVDPVDEGALIYGAVDGMVTRLDPHSKFLPPDRYRRLREETEGAYGGVGVALQRRGAALEITEVMPGSPAARAGLAPGDRVLAVDGVATDGASPQLRGAAGTRVVITVAREGWAVPRTLALIRERVRIRAVEASWLADDIAYVRIRQFQQATAAETARAVERVSRERALRGLVLDLRANPGGLFDEAVKVADLFLADGLIVTVEGRLGRDLEQHRAHPAGTVPDLALAVLIDGDSASSAEIVAGALKDRGRALLVGETTYGKGSVQSFLDLADGSGLKLTTARYITPGGRSIQSVGIEPDLAVARGAPTAPLAADPQVQSAVAALRGRHSYFPPTRTSLPASLTLRAREP